ncbi:MAG: TolC family protein [Syntrophales bacterium]
MYQFRVSALGLFLILFSLHTGIAAAAEYSLEDLFKIAIERSEKIKISEENVTIAEAGKSKALSALIPKVTAFSGYTVYDQTKYGSSAGSPVLIQPSDTSVWGARIDQSFYLNGRELTALRISRETIDRSRYDLASSRDDYLLTVAGAYYDVLRAGKGLDIADANLERLTKYRDAAKTRLRVGEVTKTTLLRAEGELSGAQSERIRARNALELTKAVLARVVGIAPDFTLKESVREERELPSLPSLFDTAMKERSDLKSLEMQKKIAEDQVAYAKGAYWPTVSLSAVYAGADQDPTSATLNRESKYVGAALNFPIFEGGFRSADVREARSRQKQSELAYADTVKSVKIDVQNAYLDLLTQKGILQFLGDQLVYARDNYNAVAKQFEFGLASSLDVIDANNLLLSAERQMADAVYSYQLAILRLDRTTGVLQKTALK